MSDYHPYTFSKNTHSYQENCACGTSPADFELSLPAVQIQICAGCAQCLKQQINDQLDKS